ncbi:cytochrome P450 [Metabacillus sp. Hm71]|uniref:cytochrome P450 n=1 Tax=Metabacillus sp. Hm71 TaxID=3450743 RepID=UPI003F42E7A3
MLNQRHEEFSLTSSEFFCNPYPFYDKLRSEHPICRGSLLKYPGWYVTGYDEVQAILKDPRFKNRIPLPHTTRNYEQLKNIQNNMVLFKNQPDHMRLRMLISKGFTSKAVEYYRPYIREAVHDLLNCIRKKKRIDIVSEYAFPLASLIIANILGVPADERHRFRDMAACLIQTIDFTRSKKVLQNGNDSMIEAAAYFNELIEMRALNPKDDLISLLSKEATDGEKLTSEELLSTCILLVIAGHETTVNLISNSILILLQHPEQLIKLKEKPELIKVAVEEFLRYESPTQLTARIASEDIELGQTTIKKGEHVYLFLGAANRDPKTFIDAHMLDITRKPNPHLAFGYGPHFCLGASLARIEAQIAIQVLVQQLPNIRLAADDLQWRKLIAFRSLTELPVAFD